MAPAQFHSRKSSAPPPFLPPRTKSSFTSRRRRNKRILWLAGALLTLFVFWTQSGRSIKPQTDSVLAHVEHADSKNAPPVVLVTTLAADMSAEHRKMVEHNRIAYAELHGYATFLANESDYPLGDDDVPLSWTRVPAVRHAMTKFAGSRDFFYLDRSALVINASLSVDAHITRRARLESILIPDQPVVPPDGVIKTLPTKSSEHVDLIIAQDPGGLAADSFIVRRSHFRCHDHGDWAHFFLDSWFDPLYRAYNFQRAEGHALEHLVQWHGTVLGRLGLVPQRTLNSYIGGFGADGASGAVGYAEGDFVANQHGCGDAEAETAAAEAGACSAGLAPYYGMFKRNLAAAVADAA